MFLTQPFPAYTPSPYLIRTTFIAGTVVFLILALFRPFNIDAPGNHFTLLHAALYGMITFVIAAVNAFALPLLFPKLFREENWTTGKELLMMLWQVVTICFANVLLTHYLYRLPVTFGNTFNFLGITAAVGIFPITLIVLLKQQALYKKYANPSFNPPASPLLSNEGQEVVAELSGENQSERVRLPVESIRYISAADNYIKVVYLHNNQLASKVMRSTLTKAQDMLEQHPQLFRCHRTYIVNSDAVYQVSGNAQGYKLHLRDTDLLVPVSRSLNDKLRARLNLQPAPSQ